MAGAMKMFTGGILVPSGVIVAWPPTAASIPPGWTRETTLDARFVKMVPTAATNPGGTGGAATHVHSQGSHGHTVNAHSHTAGSSTADSPANMLADTPAATIASGTHAHGATYTSASDPTSGGTAPADVAATSSEPPFFTVIFIKSDGTPSGIANAAVAYFNNATPPTNWRACDGASGAPDMRNRFWKGAAAAGDGGGTGGSSDSHTHTETGNHTHPSGGGHTHPVDYAAGGSVTVNDGAGSSSTPGHAHASKTSSSTDGGALTATTPGATTAADGQPPWYKLYAIQNNVGAADLPLNIIALWSGTIAMIPAAWKICDGTLGTPNLLDKFVKALNTTGELGTTGGAATHTHSGASHTHPATSHTHSTTGDLAAATGTTTRTTSGLTPNLGGSIDGAHTHTPGSTTPSNAANGTSASGSSAVSANASNDPVYTTVAYVQYQG